MFCGEGGAAMGYHRAGFNVVGVDNNRKALKRYPFPSICADVLSLDPERLRGFDAVHASPPCQAYSRFRHLVKARLGRMPDWPAFIPQTRELLRAAGVPLRDRERERSSSRSCCCAVWVDVRAERDSTPPIRVGWVVDACPVLSAHWVRGDGDVGDRMGVITGRRA